MKKKLVGLMVGLVIIGIAALHDEANASLYRLEASILVDRVHSYTWTVGSGGSNPIPLPSGMNVNAGDLATIVFEYEVTNTTPNQIIDSNGDTKNYLYGINQDFYPGFFSASVSINGQQWRLSSELNTLTEGGLYMSEGPLSPGSDDRWQQVQWRINSYDDFADTEFPFSYGDEDITMNLRDITPPNELYGLPLSVPTSEDDLHLPALDSDTYISFSSWGDIDADTGIGWQVNFVDQFESFTLRPVPIPGAVWLLGSGLTGLFALRRKKQS
ncbi:MAG: VPLPA-CTERM sorting domain-containing protein [Proteobacteria bacterium]|nr:VPLPA-CTERM sorting domain-containing protein [Pseudomonadota bacterium]